MTRRVASCFHAYRFLLGNVLSLPKPRSGESLLAPGFSRGTLYHAEA
jgi:hypothetical protein